MSTQAEQNREGLRVVHVSSSDRSGGAARAAWRLHEALQGEGMESRMLVRQKKSDDSFVRGPSTKVRKAYARATPTLEKLPLKLYGGRSRRLFHAQWTPDDIVSRLSELEPDVVHLHWICHGFMQIETVPKIPYPIVWTLHDMWPMTGGCHVSGDCTRFEETCGRCPHLGSHREIDLSRLTWKRKARAWCDVPIQVVAPSRWMAKQARRSSLLGDCRIDVIPNGLDNTVFRPISQSVARNILSLPTDAQLLLFGALGPESNPQKGFHLLQDALGCISESGGKQSLQLGIFGMSRPRERVAQVAGFPTHYLGRLDDNTTLALAYSAADLMAVPSRQESFGQTASEALACGTPVIAFDTSGLRDVVDHKKNGYLADPFDPKDLARGIRWILGDASRYRRLSDSAREKAENRFSYDQLAQSHRTLYKEVCTRESTG